MAFLAKVWEKRSQGLRLPPRCPREVPRLIARDDGSEVTCHALEEERIE
ncbi:hypothetical protein QLQ85_10010 [Halomonas sp. M4R5S39]|nr:hypothetical protein [Halomonas kalidii]MDI5985128.1 hypothetical protein [Halomonas kalidii]